MQVGPVLRDAFPRVGGVAERGDDLALSHRLAHDEARGGDLKCVGLPPTIQQVANLIAMGDLIEFYDTLPEALRSFRGSTVGAAQ